MNSPQPILRCLESADSDVHLLASQYSLIDHAHAIEEGSPKAREKGVSFVVGSALNAGFLGGEPRYNYGEENSLIPAEKRQKLAHLREIAGYHGVDLVAAALQFSFAPDVASAPIVGTAKPLHILADLRRFTRRFRQCSGTSCGERHYSRRNCRPGLRWKAGPGSTFMINVA